MRPALSRNVAASVLNAAAVVSISLVTVPLILDAVGTAGYGAWTLGLALILYASILETGLGPAVQRFTAFARGGEDVAALGRLGWTTLALYAAGGVLLGGVLAALAPVLVDVFDPPARLRADAETMFRVQGGALALALLAAGMGNLLQGLERFGTLAVSAAAGALAFLAGVIVLADPQGLPGLAIAACIGQGVTLIVRAGALRGRRVRRPPDAAVASRGSGASSDSRPACRSRCSLSLSTGRATSLSSGSLPRPRPSVSSASAPSSPTAGGCSQAPPSPPSRPRSRSPPGRATSRSCAAASPSCTGCGCSACSAPARSAPPRCRR